MSKLKLVIFILLGIMLVLIPLLGACEEEVTPPGEEDVTPPGEEEEVEPIVLTFGTITPETHVVGQALTSWMNKIEEETDGRVQWETYFGSLVSPTESYSEIQSGLVDVGTIGAAYERTGFDISKNWGSFFVGASSMEVQSLVFQELVATFPQIFAEYEELKMLDMGIFTPNYQLLTTKPARSLEDLGGLQLKALAGIQVEVLNQLGAVGIVMSMYDVFPALEKGTIDGILGPTETLMTMNLAEVTKYHTTLDIAYGGTPTIGMNWNTWNSLPSEIQQVFEDNVQFFSDEIIRLWNISTENSISYSEGMGVEFIELPPADIQQFNDAVRAEALEVAAMLDALGLPGTEIYEEVQRLIKEYQE